MTSVLLTLLPCLLLALMKPAAIAVGRKPRQPLPHSCVLPAVEDVSLQMAAALASTYIISALGQPEPRAPARLCLDPLTHTNSRTTPVVSIPRIWGDLLLNHR